MKPKLWVFDVDGTLVDSLSSSYEVDKQIIGEMGGNVPDIETYRRYLGEGSWTDFYRMFGIKDTDEALSLYHSRTAQLATKPIPGAKDLLQSLIDKGIARAIVSINECQDRIISKLRSAGLKDYFSLNLVYCERDSKVRAIKDVCAKEKISPEDALYIGDTAKDVREARIAGVRTAAVSNRFSYNPDDLIRQANPDHLVTDISDLISLLGDEK